jgi:uncharacterized DUF497 family protein
MYDYFDFDLNQMSFEWDERKDQINFAKHGIHFKTAVKVFLDPNKLEPVHTNASIIMTNKRKPAKMISSLS